MEKMNQVSVTEFMSKSKEEMYDMAVEMVENYNRLIDICNDSAERMADLIERHSVYTNALNQDIAAKAAKIDLLEKEIEGRKEGYVALKTQMDHVRESASYWQGEYTKVREENEKLKKESEKWQDLAKMNRDTIVNQYEVCEEFKNKIAELEKKVKHQKENLDGINKTLEVKAKENERLIAVRNNQKREIEAHESENARLTEKIMELKKERDKHMAGVNDLRMELDCLKASKEKHEEAARDKTIEDLRESFTYWRTQCLAAQEARDAFMKEVEDLRKEKEWYKKQLEGEVKETKETYNAAIERRDKEIEKLKKELNESYKAWDTDSKNHTKRDMTLVDEIAKKNNEIEKLKVDLVHEREKNEKLAKDHAELENDMRKRVTDIIIQSKTICNLKKELDHTKVEPKEKEDDHGRKGFKEYIKWLVKEEEGKFKESWKARLNEELEAIFKEEEETEVTKVIRCTKPNNFHCIYGDDCPVEAAEKCKFAKEENDIPCGSDSIE